MLVLYLLLGQASLMTLSDTSVSAVVTRTPPAECGDFETMVKVPRLAECEGVGPLGKELYQTPIRTHLLESWATAGGDPASRLWVVTPASFCSQMEDLEGLLPPVESMVVMTPDEHVTDVESFPNYEGTEDSDCVTKEVKVFTEENGFNVGSCLGKLYCSGYLQLN